MNKVVFQCDTCKNGATSASPLIGKYCGTDIPKQIASHADKLFLFFKSDLSRNEKGFRITWSSAATGCGGILTSPSGSIISPHYPEPYSRNTECIWKIIISTASRIQIIFSDINLEKHVQCQADYVQLFDGLTTASESLGKFCNGVSEPIKSTNNKMLVKFRSDVALQGRGFQLQYTTVCRNTVKGYRGVIESPNFPNEYPQDEDCLWEIVVSDGNKINITFSHFELERSLTYTNDSCSFDYIEITYADPLPQFEEERTYTKYGRYCGEQNPGHLSFDSDHVKIHFVSDRLLRGSGFRLEWEMVGCGGHLKGNSGTITSPNYPNSYPASVVCEWLIEVNYGKSIEIEFHEVDIEKDSSCQFDSIKIFNGPDETHNLLTTICKQKKISVVSSTGNFMFIKFQSDYSYHGKGFLANYTTVPTTCGGRFTATSGKIFSPNYPKNYNGNETCEYFISVDEGHSIELKFEDVDLFSSINCSTNYVKVHDGPSLTSPVLATVCGREMPNNTITSTLNNMYIEFMSHTYFSTKGFLAKYTKACGSRITTKDRGFIRVEQDEFSEDLSTCTWTIISSDPSKHISLSITFMHGVNYCEWQIDTLKIYNGDSVDSPLLKSLCGSKVPPTLVSDGSALTIYLDTPMSFFATYSVYDSQCGGTLTSSEGSFSTPGYPNQYASGVECEWTIQISPGNHVSLDFTEFNILDSDGCNTDFLEIRSFNSSGPLWGTYCGNNKPENISHVGSIWLLYKGSKLEVGDAPITAKGFFAEYQLDDFSELTGPRGEIYSPFYPLPYLEYKTFSWKITVAVRKRILLTFKEFYLDVKDVLDEDCYFVIFEVFDGVDDTAPSLGRLCGSTRPEPIKSTSNIIFIKVEYNSARMGSKFIVGWEEVAGFNPFATIPPKSNTTCGMSEVINMNTLHNYTLESPGYPHGYANDLKCEWIFSTIPMNHLEIKFTSLNFGFSQFAQRCDILSDHVRLFQKHSYDNDWQLIEDLCKYKMDTFSATDLLKVQFDTTRFINGTGFKAMVVDACGGYLSGPTGYIIFNSLNPRADLCAWNITVRTTKTIEVVFEEMNIQNDKTKGCDNYVIVRNGKYPDSNILGTGKYCGSELPGKLTSTGNNLYIKYNGESDMSTFRLKYQEVSASCGGEIILSAYDNQTEISSPNYPNIPTPHIECEWLIRSPPGESLRIDFLERFDITQSKSCEVEYVEIRDGGTEFSKSFGKYCSSMPSSQITTDNMMFIKFFTDIDDPKNGFKARITINRCGGKLLAKEGELAFSNPTNAERVDCTWHIIGSATHYLSVSFTQMDIKKSVNCTDAFIELYEQNNLPGSSNRTMLRLCGKAIPDRFDTSSNELFVHYVGVNSGKFRLNFKSSQSECGGILEKVSGEIKTPGYPVRIEPRICRWIIRVPEGRRITLNIVDFDVNVVEGKSEAFLFAYDGTIISRMNRINNGSDRTIQSSSNEMLVLFYSLNPSGRRGIKANFTSNEPTICLGDFSKSSGVLRTPPARNHFYNCLWTHNTNNFLLNQTTSLTISMSTTSNETTSFKTCEYAAGSVVVTNEDKKNILNNICSSTVRPIIVRSPFSITKLQALVSNEYHMNFSVSYDTHQCGGIKVSQSGYIASPDFPNQPSETFECAWLLKVDEGQTISITITTLELGDDCEKSFLKIYNGGLPTHPQIVKLCRNTKPGSIISQSNKMWIEYRWEKGSSGSGFQLQYEAISTGCGGYFHDKSRIIQTPNHEADYPNNAECLWIIQADPGYHLSLDFIGRFHIEDSNNCTNDYLEIFDWINEEWVSLGRKCGRSNPVDIKSSSEKMKLLFRTNDRITASGFKAKWNWQCGGRFLATKEPRVLVSAGYPLYYERNTRCEYVIEAKFDILSLRFLDFDVEPGVTQCENDNVTISGEDYRPISFLSSNVYCGDKLPPPHRMKGSATIIFRTDEYYSRGGFKLEYKDESCGGDIKEETTIEVKPISNSFAGPRYYQPKIDCIWNITAPPNQIVILTVGELHLNLGPMCFGQSLQIFDDSQENRSSRLAQLCGEINEEYSIASTSNRMLIKFHGMPTNFGGMKAEVRFSHGPKEGCGGILNLTNTMYIQSPNLPNLDCGWKIIVPRDYQVQIEITELNLPSTCGNKNDSYAPCDCSHIEIRDGGGSFSDEIEHICPNNSVHSYTSISTSRNMAFIRLVLSGRKENAFKATLKPVISVCGSSVLNVTKDMKILTSPNFPNPYPPNIKCTYIFSIPTPYERISLHFVEFDLTEEIKPAEHIQLTRCMGDTIQIFEDPNNSEVQEGLGPGTIFNGRSKSFSMSYNDLHGRHIFCGKEDKPFDFYSSGKAVSLTLISSNSIIKGSGFKLEYSVAGCNRNYTELQGRVFNGNDKKECFISIIVPENRTISLYFNTFYMIHSANCTSSSLEVRDASPTGKILMTACGYKLPNPVFSFSNKLFIHARNSIERGFLMRYDFVYTSTEDGRGCGGELFNNKGKIYSPMYPDVFRNDTTCTWLIQVPVGLHAAMKFTVFDIQGSCDQTSVEVTSHTGYAATKNTLVLCQEYQPGPIIRSESSIKIVYRSSIHNGGTGWVAQFQAVTTDITNIT
ncbi:hypothetical protein JTB14_021141 [Gonioctena quinquepunctata]|nr:hypothetical protein JTB14_021141 [Gonioctena quinquepunctata]